MIISPSRHRGEEQVLVSIKVKVGRMELPWFSYSKNLILKNVEGSRAGMGGTVLDL